MANTPNLVQSHARFYYDTGAENAQTAAAAIDTNVTIPVSFGADGFLCVRIQVNNNGTGSASATNYQLQVSKNGGAYANVTTTSSNVKAYNSANLTGGGATTNQLTSPGGTFAAGQVYENGGASGSMGLPNSSFTEFLYTLDLVNSDLANGDTLDFRVLSGTGAALNSYSVTPRITVSKGTALTVANANSASQAGAVTLSPKTALAPAAAVSASQTTSPAVSNPASLTISSPVSISSNGVLSTVLSLAFATAAYSVLGTSYGSLGAVPGFTYTRSGAFQVVDSDNSIDSFAADTPPINGYGLYQASGTTNHLLRSQEFDNASWGKAGTVITANSVAAPDGTTTADTMTADNSGITGATGITQNVVFTSAGTKTISVIAKMGGCRWLFLSAGSFDTNGQADFDLLNGVVGTVGGSASASIRSLGNGWYLCSIDLTMTGSDLFGSIGVLFGAGGGSTLVTRNGTNSIYLWQAQALSQGFGSVGLPLIVTTSAAASIGDPALSVAMPNGNYGAIYTFDDNSTQVLPVAISGGTFTPATYPTLNRPRVKKVELIQAVALTLLPKTALILASAASLSQASALTLTPRWSLTVANAASLSQATSLTIQAKWALAVANAVSAGTVTGPLTLPYTPAQPAPASRATAVFGGLSSGRTATINVLGSRVVTLQ